MDREFISAIIVVCLLLVNYYIRYRDSIRSILIKKPKMEPGEMYYGEDDQTTPEKYKGVFSVKIERQPIDYED